MDCNWQMIIVFSKLFGAPRKPRDNNDPSDWEPLSNADNILKLESKLIDGRNIVMAGYSLYGGSTQMVICKYGKVDIFRMAWALSEWISREMWAYLNDFF